MTAPSNARDGMVFGTGRSKLAAAMNKVRVPEDVDVTFAESRATMVRYRESAGVDNPFGKGLAAYEPNTVIFDEYANAFGAVQADKQQRQLQEAAQGFTDVPGAPGPTEPFAEGNGMVATAISKAMDLANRRVPYVWGGTSANGVDCSGLIYYAYNAAGIKIPRMRAVDYAKMAAPIDRAQARPGDLVYWDNPNTSTDHIGIYLGGDKVVQAPTTGDVVKVSTIWQNPPPQFRRIASDDQFAMAATPAGAPAWSYSGRPYNPTPGGNTIRRTFPNVEE